MGGHLLQEPRVNTMFDLLQEEAGSMLWTTTTPPPKNMAAARHGSSVALLPGPTEE